MTQLFAIAPDWKWKTLSETSEYIQRGKSTKYSELSEMTVINQKCIRWSGLDITHARYIADEQIDKWNSERILRNGDLLWNSTGTGTIGRACIFDKDTAKETYVVDSHVTIVRTDKRLLSEYLFYWIYSPFVQNGFEKLQTGSTNQVELSRKAVLDTLIPVPPVETQRNIVQKIRVLFNEIDDAARVIKNIEKSLSLYKQSILNAAIRGKLVPQDPNDEPASVLLERIREEKKALIAAGKIKKEKPLPPISPDEIPFEVPEGWVWVRLGDIGQLSRGKSKHRPRNDPKLFINGHYPFIQTGDITAASKTNFMVSTFHGHYNDFGLMQSKLWEKGSLCITIAANIADVAFLEFDSCIPDSVVVFDPLIDPTLSQYVFVYLLATKQKIEAFAPATAQKNINLAILNELMVPLPPKAIIQRINDKVRKTLTEEQVLISKIEYLTGLAKQMKQSILKTAFEGKLL